MEIKFQFTPTKNDYIKCLQAFGSSIWGSLLAICGLAVLEIFLGNYAFDAPELRTRADWFTVFTFPLLPPLLAIAIFFLVPIFNGIRIGSQVEANEQLKSPVAWHIDNAQIIVKNKVSESKLDWSVFSRAIEIEPFYLLVYSANKRMFNFIPKRAFESPQQEMEFRALVEQKLGKLKDDHFQKRILPLLLHLGGIVLLTVMMLGYWVMLFREIFGYQ